MFTNILHGIGAGLMFFLGPLKWAFLVLFVVVIGAKTYIALHKPVGRR